MINRLTQEATKDALWSNTRSRNVVELASCYGFDLRPHSEWGPDIAGFRGFLFSGLMLSPDLDLHSRPFKRWGWLRWIWIPYQQAIAHRSVLSHGFLIGTTVRVVYLVGWIVCLGVLSLAVVQSFQDVAWSWQQFAQDVRRSLINDSAQWLALFLGLELGAMSHSLSDWLGSAYKRSKRKRSKQPTRRTAKKRQR